MRAAVRRLTWVLLSLCLMTVLAFGLLARLIPEPRASALPLFLNSEPRNVRDLSLSTFTKLVEDPSSAANAAQISRLGGAALPFVLPELERLDPELRGRVALALRPIALRMGTAEPEEINNAEQAAQFWLRFWQDRSVDFREPVAKRLVERLSHRSLSSRRNDVLELDTYALPYLMEALGKIQTAEDVRRANRLTTVLEHVTGQPFVVAPTAGVSEARSVVSNWRRWWEDNGADFTTLNGPGRVTAMVKETAYGRWLSSVLRGELGRLRDGGTGLDLLRRTATTSLVTFLLVVLLGGLLGASGAALLWRSDPRLSGFAATAALLVAAIPTVALFAHAGSSSGTGLVIAGLAVPEALRVGVVVWRSAELRDWSNLSTRLRQALSFATTLMGPSAPFIASAVLAAECALGLSGLGSALRSALEDADLHAAMAVSLSFSVAGALAILVADALRALLSFRAEEP